VDGDTLLDIKNKPFRIPFPNDEFLDTPLTILGLGVSVDRSKNSLREALIEYSSQFMINSLYNVLIPVTTTGSDKLNLSLYRWTIGSIGTNDKQSNAKAFSEVRDEASNSE
jgi:hypothetical protein